MNKIILSGIVLGLLAVPTIAAEEATQDVVVEQSGDIIVIIQRNINKVVREDKVNE